MSLHPQPIGPVPEETARVARAAFHGGNVYMALRDELGTIFRDEEFAALYPSRGRPAEAPWRLALVTVFQFAEGLSDRRAADAVRGRIDWKYAARPDAGRPRVRCLGPLRVPAPTARRPGRAAAPGRPPGPMPRAGLA